MEGFEKLEVVRERINNDTYLLESIEQWLNDDTMAQLAEDIAKDNDIFADEENKQEYENPNYQYNPWGIAPSLEEIAIATVEDD